MSDRKPEDEKLTHALFEAGVTRALDIGALCEDQRVPLGAATAMAFLIMASIQAQKCPEPLDAAAFAALSRWVYESVQRSGVVELAAHLRAMQQSPPYPCTDVPPDTGGER